MVNRSESLVGAKKIFEPEVLPKVEPLGVLAKKLAREFVDGLSPIERVIEERVEKKWVFGDPTIGFDEATWNRSNFNILVKKGLIEAKIKKACAGDNKKEEKLLLAIMEETKRILKQESTIEIKAQKRK